MHLSSLDITVRAFVVLVDYQGWFDHGADFGELILDVVVLEFEVWELKDFLFHGLEGCFLGFVVGIELV